MCELCAVGWFTTTQQMQHLGLAIEWLFHSLVYIYTNIEYIYIEPMLTLGVKCTGPPARRTRAESRPYSTLFLGPRG
jgi:hypothetical protein